VEVKHRSPGKGRTSGNFTMSTDISETANYRNNDVLAEHVAAINKLGKRVLADIIEIGERLVDVRDNLLDHGEWLPWLEREFGWKERSAQTFIQVYEASKSANFADLDLPVSAVYLLAAPSTPEPAQRSSSAPRRARSSRSRKSGRRSPGRDRRRRPGRDLPIVVH
jgi:hypothetical protein